MIKLLTIHYIIDLCINVIGNALVKSFQQPICMDPGMMDPGMMDMCNESITYDGSVFVPRNDFGAIYTALCNVYDAANINAGQIVDMGSGNPGERFWQEIKYVGT